MISLKETISKKVNLISGSLDEYSGVWDYSSAAHLLRRTTFGPSQSKIKEAIASGLAGSVEKLLDLDSKVDPPIDYNVADESFGMPWHNIHWPNNVKNLQHKQFLKAWLHKNILKENFSIKEKMRLFWQSHFALLAPMVTTSQQVWKYYDTLETFLLGNFRALIREITIDPAMLYFLNGATNSAENPNENYGRELMELYTLGKGAIADPGDYTTFTELDVKEVSKALTGWAVKYEIIDEVTARFSSFFVENRHKEGEKQLSHRFENTLIAENGQEEYKDVIDIIFNKQPSTVAKFIVEKIYVYFVNYRIDDEIREKVINPLAELFIENDFEIRPVLDCLFKSEHFYDQCNRGVMIKSPIDYTATIIKQLDFFIPEDTEKSYKTYSTITTWNRGLGQEYDNPPNVAGWKAYYQKPVYYKFWINSNFMQLRKQMLSSFFYGNQNVFGHSERLDVLNLAQSMDNPTDPNDLINDLAKLLYPAEISIVLLEDLKQNLLTGQTDDSYWTELYFDYLNNPDDEIVKGAVESRLRNLLFSMMILPEYHLM